MPRLIGSFLAEKWTAAPNRAVFQFSRIRPLIPGATQRPPPPMKTRILIGVAFIFLAMQAFRPSRNLSATALFAEKGDVTVLFPTAPAIRQILRDSCYDCHSNHTTSPWYADVQPVGWWLANHVDSGRRKLNFAEFGAYPRTQQMKKLEATSDKVRDQKMPLASYTLIHRAAKLSDAQIAVLRRWAESIRQDLAKR